MSGPITTALRDIILEIDPIIVKAGFRDEYVTFGGSTRNAHDIIKERIILGHVLPDLSIIAPVETWIDLKHDYIIAKDDEKVLVSIPPNVVGNRPIISPLQVAYSQGATWYGSGNVVDSHSSRIVHSTPNIAGVSSTELKLMGGENTVLLMNFSHADIALYKMEVLLGHDAQFSDIPASYWKLFSKLCMLKTKHYLYSKQASILDIVESNGGISITSLRNIFDRWSDAGVTYEEEVERWKLYSGMYDDDANDDWTRFTTSFT